MTAGIVPEMLFRFGTLWLVAAVLASLPLGASMVFAQVASSGPSTVSPTTDDNTTTAPQPAVTQPAVELVERLQHPTILRLAATALALRQLADPNFRQRFEQEFTQSEANYLLGLLNVGALYRGTIVHGNVDAAALIDRNLNMSTSINASIEWELPICKVLSAKGLLSQSWSNGSNVNLQGYIEGSACLPVVVSSLELRLGYRFGVRPSVVERGLHIQNEFSGFDGGVTIRAFRMLRKTWDLDIYSTNFGLSVNQYADPAIGDALSFRTNFSMVSLHRYGKGFGSTTQTQDFMRFAIAVEDNLQSRLALAVALDVIRIDSIQLGKHLAIGGAVGVVQESVENTRKPADTADTASNGIRWRPGGSLIVKIGDPATFAETKLSASSQIGTLGTAQRDLRLTQRLVTQSERIYVDAQFWIGRSKLLTLDGDNQRISPANLVWETTIDAIAPVYKGIQLYTRAQAGNILVPGATSMDPVQTATVLSAIGGFTFKWDQEFVNHRKPVVNGDWSGPILMRK